MSFLKQLDYDDNLQQETDSLGGYRVLDSGIYDAVIKYAYLSKAQSGSGAINFEFDINGNEYRETLYVTDKYGKNIWKKNGKSGYLPSFLTADAISLFATGEKSVFELDDTQKEIELYNYDAGKKLPTEVPMLMELIGKKVKLGIQKQKVFKQQKDANGNYVDTAETKEVNTIDKVFSAKDNRTVPEVRAGQTEAAFYQEWLNKYENQVIDKTQGKTPAKTLNTTTPKKGLFSA